MFPKGKRVKSEDYDAVLSSGKNINSDFLYIKYVLGGDSVKVSTVVPKKVLNKAVKRIKNKRKINSALSPLLENLSFGKYVVFTKKGIDDLTHEEVSKELKKIISQLNNN